MSICYQVHHLCMLQTFNNLFFRKPEFTDKHISAAIGDYNLFQLYTTLKDIGFYHFGNAKELDRHKARLAKGGNTDSLYRSRNFYFL